MLSPSKMRHLLPLLQCVKDNRTFQALISLREIVNYVNERETKFTDSIGQACSRACIVVDTLVRSCVMLLVTIVIPVIFGTPVVVHEPFNSSNADYTLEPVPFPPLLHTVND
jgi:hypothetical protein